MTHRAEAGALMLLAIVSIADSQTWAQDRCRPSAAAARLLKAAQESMSARLYAAALTKLQEVQSIPDRSSCDDYLLNEMLGFTYVRMKQYADAARHLELGFNSPHFDSSQEVSRINALAQVNYQLKNYDKAIDYGTRSIDVSYAEEDMVTLVGQSYYIKGDYAGALHFLERQLADKERNGVRPRESFLVLLLSASIKTDDDDRISQYLQRLSQINPAKYEDHYRRHSRLRD